MKWNIAVVTGTRAEYGLLKPIIKKLKKNPDLNTKIYCTGMHLSPEFGYTINDIKNDGFDIDEEVEIILSSDSSVGISKAIGLAMISFGEIFRRENLDLIILLGDRFEIFSVATAASISKIPIAHLHGGETTEGAFDESFRHAITKFSQLHFTSTNDYMERVIQLGENPDQVYNVGSLGIENIKSETLLQKNELEKFLEMKLSKPILLVTYHPETLSQKPTDEKVKQLIGALSIFSKTHHIIITKANADTEGRIINEMFEQFSKEYSDVHLFSNLGMTRYLSLLKLSDVVIGNSSSGIIEAASLGVPTVNIGNRQKGRIQPNSVINCKNEKEDILHAIHKTIDIKGQNFINPYEGENTSETIVNTILLNLDIGISTYKSFYDLKK